MTAAHNIRRFGFDRIFAEPVQSNPGSPADMELELEALKAEFALFRQDRDAELARARTEAFEAGLAHARTEREMAFLTAVDALQGSLEAVQDEFAELGTRLTREATQVALAAADILAARALEQAPEQAIDEALGRVLEQVARGTQLVVRINPALEQAVTELVTLRQSRERRRLDIIVVADTAVAPGDASIAWEEGGLSLEQSARRAAVMEELAPLLAG